MSIFRKHLNSTAVIVSLILTFSCTEAQSDLTMDLSGQWTIKLDPENLGKKEKWYLQEFTNTISLPGTTDEAGLGQPEKYDNPYNALVRPHYYVGKVWYQREIKISEEQANKHFTLYLERIHWITEVWVNGKYAGTQNSLCTAQEFDLTKFIKPGKNQLSICINNKYPFSLGGFASSVSEHTQSNWNGIVGRIELQMKDLVYMDDLRVYPSIDNKAAKVRLTLFNKSGEKQSGSIVFNPSLLNGNLKVKPIKVDYEITESSKTIEALVPLGNDIKLWNEFTPNLYQMEAVMTSGEFKDRTYTTFGMRELGVKDKNFTINGKKTYMRGNLECCIFPLTGYPSMDVESWTTILQRQKELGMNHVRFHSWCPPNAAFEAANKLGMYIQAEAPRANVGADSVRDFFIKQELLRINRAYGNHPSFMFMTGGNELAANEEQAHVNSDMIVEARKDDNRHLYSTTSGGHGMDHKQSRTQVDQYRVGGARGFQFPGTTEDRGDYYAKCNWASITHEVGQHASYPSVEEIQKYKGVLKPVNLEAIRDDLKEKGMLRLAKQFTDATTHHAAILYKEEIEVLMRSNYNAGFQLLSLHDYPGQGTSHVGLFDAFWDNKGGISPAQFRKFCGPVVPLLRMPKRTYTSNEMFKASAEITNYSWNDIIGAEVAWNIKTQTGEIVAKGDLKKQNLMQGERTPLGEIEAKLASITKAEKLTISVFLKNQEILNDWDIWCYPANNSKEWPADITVCKTLNSKAKEALNNGEIVLLLPSEENLTNSLPGDPKTVFWSPDWWFTKPRGGNTSMSILCNPQHPVFENFPTEYHSNWQWWSLKKNSNSIVLDTLNTNVKPIVRIIDNFRRNHKLATLLEFSIGEGKLMICSMDIESRLENRPAANQLRISIIDYIQSNNFAPKQEIEINELQKLFK